MFKKNWNGILAIDAAKNNPSIKQSALTVTFFDTKVNQSFFQKVTSSTSYLKIEESILHKV